MRAAKGKETLEMSATALVTSNEYPKKKGELTSVHCVTKQLELVMTKIADKETREALAT